MTPDQIRKSYSEFMTKRGAFEIPSASLVPENDPSTLFTGSGMQPMVPYLLGETHPAGRDLINIQKCCRTGDIEEVGDNFKINSENDNQLNYALKLFNS